MKYSIIQNNKVINVIEADEAFILSNFDHAIAIQGALPIGAYYDDHKVYTPIKIHPSQIVPTTQYLSGAKRTISVGDFMQRFTPEQRISIRHIMRDYDHPLCDSVTDLYEQLILFGEVQLDRQDLSDGLDFFIAQGLIQPYEKSNLLRDAEIYEII